MEKFRKHFADREKVESKMMYIQAKGTLLCIRKLIDKGVAIPPEVVAELEVDERQYEAELRSMRVEVIEEKDYAFSPVPEWAKKFEVVVLPVDNQFGMNRGFMIVDEMALLRRSVSADRMFSL